jgi:hypothetical protein
VTNQDGKTIHDSLLQEKGEGIQHVGFAVQEFRKAIALDGAKGLDPPALPFGQPAMGGAKSQSKFA